MKNQQLTRLDTAKKKVSQIKGFYNHLAVYIIVNIALFLLQGKMTFILLSKRVFGSPELLETINWDVFGTPVVWGIILIIHGTNVFGNGFFFGRKWEERQIQKYMEEEKKAKENSIL